MSTPQSISNGYLARFWQILPESCKIMHYLARFLPESCKITIFLPESCKITIFLPESCKITIFLPESCKITIFLPESCKIAIFLPESHKIIISLSESSNISTFLHKILRDELTNASNSDSKYKVLRSSKNGKMKIITFFGQWQKKLSVRS